MRNRKMRLIDAYACPSLFDEEFKKTRRLIQQGEWHLDNLAEGFTEADRVIRKMPTVDAVPVVRCKDCKHRRIVDFGARYCMVWQAYNGFGDEGFCNYGERKEKDD